MGFNSGFKGLKREMIVRKCLWFAMSCLEVVGERYRRLRGLISCRLCFMLCWFARVCFASFWKVGLWILVSGWRWYLIFIAFSAVRKTRKLRF